MDIKNVIIIGLGALGTTYANKIKDYCNLRILADEGRINKYKKNPLVYNGKTSDFNYISESTDFKADLIIIATKFSSLNDVIKSIKNFVYENTIIISVINGIRSENIIEKFYPKNVIYSYYIGGSAIKNGNCITHSDTFKTVIGCIDGAHKNKVYFLKEFFNRCHLDCEISDEILYSMWVKFGVNIVLNQMSAIYNLTVGELKKRKSYMNDSKNLLSEVIEIAKKSDINNLEHFMEDVYKQINLVNDSGVTSMLQDIRAKRKTELESFSGEIVNLGKEFGIDTPFNYNIYSSLKRIEDSYL